MLQSVGNHGMTEDQPATLSEDMTDNHESRCESH